MTFRTFVHSLFVLAASALPGLAQTVATLPSSLSAKHEEAHKLYDEALVQRAFHELSQLESRKIPAYYDEADYLKAMADLEAGNYNLAEAAFSEYDERHPGSGYGGLVAFHRAELSFRQSRWEEASDRFLEAITLLKNSASSAQGADTLERSLLHQSQFWRANSLALLGKYEDAALCYQACAADSSQQFADNALYALGQLEEAHSRYTQAASYYRRIESNFNFSDVLIAAKVRHAQCLLYQRESSNAITQLASAENALHALRQSDSLHATTSSQLLYHRESDIHFLRAEAENQLLQFEQAIDEYTLVLSDSASSPEVRKQSLLGRGWSYLNLQKWDDALRSYNLVIDSIPHSESQAESLARLYRCIALKKKGDRALATQELSVLSSSAAYSQVALALLELGQIYYEDAKYDAARRALERASHETPDIISSLRIHLLLGAVYVELQEFKKAVQSYQTAEIALKKAATLNATERDTYLAEIRLKHGIAAVEDFQYRDAMSYLNAFIASHTSDPRVDEALFWLCEAFYHAELMKNAVESYQKLIQNYGASKRREEAYYGLGWSYFRTRDFEKAQLTFSQMLSEFPQSRFAPDVYVRKGDALYLTKNYIEAAKAYKEAYKINPKEEQGQYAQFQIGQSLYRAKDYATATAQLRQFAKNFPKSVFADHALYTIAYIATLQEHHDEAIAGFQSMMSAYPQSELVPAAMFYIANSYYSKGDYESAIKEYRSLMETFRSSYYGIEALRGLQESLSVLGRNDEAIEVGKNYMASNPDGALREQINMKTIEIFLRKGDYPSAAKEYQDFLKKFPDSDYGAEALFLLAKSQMGMNDMEAALQSFSLLHARYPKSDFASQGLLQSALVHLSRSNLNSADSTFELVIHDYPQTELASRACYERAQMALIKSDTVRALALLHSSVDINLGEYSYQSLYKLGMYYRSVMQNDSARQYFGKIGHYAENSSLAAEALYRIGESYFEEKNYQKAAESFESVKAHFDGVEDWYTLSLINLGECYDKLQNPSKAKEVYQTVIILHPADDYGKTAQSRLKRLK